MVQTTDGISVSQHLQPIKVLTIGGSDSGGAAGIQADLKTWTMLGVYGMSVLAVVTAQNSVSVNDLYRLPLEFVASQLDAVLGDYGAQGTKTGFLGAVELIEVVAGAVTAYELTNVIVDPVLVNHRGESMFPDSVTQAYVDHLLPVADLVTPNVREAELLTGMSIVDRDSAVSAADRLHSMGSSSVLVTGRRDGMEMVDLLFDGETPVEYRSPWTDTPNRHGSGDVLSAAICALLALGLSVGEAIAGARAFTNAAIEDAKDWQLGAGHGPVSSWGNRQITKK